MSSKKEQHWAKTRSLTFTVLAVWAVIAFAILVFWFASRQNKIDEEFGLEEK